MSGLTPGFLDSTNFDSLDQRSDPADPEQVRTSDEAESIAVRVVVILPEERKDWKVRRVFSQYNSREIFTSPNAVEWVRVSVQAFNPERGDIKVVCTTRGLQPILLRRRDAFVANLRKDGV